MFEDTSELAVLSHWLPGLEPHDTCPRMIVGPGDDCAVLPFGGGKLLAAVDSVISNVHFFHDSTPPEKAAAKLLKRNISDVAAMGGTPLWALLALNVSALERSWIDRFFSGLRDCAAKYNVAVAGGDYAAVPLKDPGTVASLTLLGEAPEHPVLRSGAKPGDGVWVTGSFGNSLAGKHLDFEPRLAEGRFLAENLLASSMLDVSDSLAGDLRRIAEASRVTVQLQTARIPCNTTLTAALADGEDYELAFTVPAEKENELLAGWKFDVPVSRIGKVLPAGDGLLVDENNILIEVKGYEHNNR